MHTGSERQENIDADIGPSARWTLRQRTDAAHRRIDARFSALALDRREDYRRFLAASAAALLPLEAMLESEGVAAVMPDWTARARSGAISADLVGLGARASAIALRQRPLGVAQMLGVLYVLEGSRLGAQVLLRRVMASDDAVVTANTRYLAHGREERFWQRFLDRLDGRARDVDETAGAIDGALFAFAAFEEGMEAIMSGACGSGSHDGRH